MRLNSSRLADEFASKQQFWQSSKCITLNVGFKPIVSVDVHNKIANAKLYGASSLNRKLKLFNETEAVFVCSYEANPVEAVKVVWLINGKPQVQTDFSNRHLFSWKLRANRFDASVKSMNLTCEASNSLGKGSFTYEIALLYDPVLRTDKIVYDVNESNPIQVCLIS